MSERNVMICLYLGEGEEDDEEGVEGKGIAIRMEKERGERWIRKE